MVLDRQLTPGMTCLDFGCGDGRGAGTYISQKGCRYVGADISVGALRKAQAGGLRVCQVRDPNGIPFRSGAFDAVICLEVLEHLFRPDLALAEFGRVLRPQGVLIVTVPNAAYWHRRAELAVMGRWNPYGDDRSITEPWRDPHIRFLTNRSLRNVITRAGFDNVSIGGHGGGIPWLRHRSTLVEGAYRALEKHWPAMLSSNLIAVAHRI
jgi:2-polyprenyl-6-hydroxyphenyl methylase/3-demethylubiquinone-9 3-methyltransferase